MYFFFYQVLGFPWFLGTHHRVIENALAKLNQGEKKNGGSDGSFKKVWYCGMVPYHIGCIHVTIFHSLHTHNKIKELRVDAFFLKDSQSSDGVCSTNECPKGQELGT